MKRGEVGSKWLVLSRDSIVPFSFCGFLCATEPSRKPCLVGGEVVLVARVVPGKVGEKGVPSR